MNKITIGSRVKTVGDFEELRMLWNLPYPKKGDVLTVKSIEQHPNKKLRDMGIVLLYFVESSNTKGICNKTAYGDFNFILIPPIQNEEIELFEEFSSDFSMSILDEYEYIRRD